MKCLFAPLRERRALCAAYVLLGLCAQLLETYGAALFSQVIDALGAGSLTLSRCALYAAVLAGVIVLYYLEEAPDAYLKKDFELRFRLMGMDKARRVDFLRCAQMGTGTLLTRVENGAAAGRDMLIFYLRCARELLPGAIFSLVFIFTLHRGVFVGVLAGYAVVFAATRLLLTRLERIKEGVLVGEEALGQLCVRAVTELVPLRLLGAYPALLHKAREHAARITGNVTRLQMTHEAFFAGFALLTVLAKAAVLAAAVLTGEIGVGAAAALLLLVDKAYQPVAVFGVCYVSYKLDRASFARYAQFLDLPDEGRMDTGKALAAARGEVTARGITVRLGQRQVLHDVSVAFGDGRFTLLCGESGSGKSTLLQLIAGLLCPDAGDITLGGQSLLDVSLPSLYTHMVYVPQEAPVLCGTVRENVVLDARDRDQEVRVALERVGLGEWLQKLPQGLDTPVGERGFTLSGGERQRLCLARALLTDAQLILLDEATSALDAVSERQVLCALREAFAGRTVIYCAHRLRVAREADEIVVMRDGRVVQQGGFDALRKEPGEFRTLYSAQEQKRGERLAQ